MTKTNEFTLAEISKTQDRIYVYYYYKDPAYPERPLKNYRNRRKEYGDINKKRTKKEKLQEARLLKVSINELLLSGWSPYQDHLEISLCAELGIDVGIDEAIDTAHQLVKQQYKERTHTSYWKIIKKFKEYLQEKHPSVTAIKQVEKRHVIAYLDSLILAGRKAKTRNCHCGTIRTYFDLLLERELVTANPCDGIKWLKINKENKFKHHKIDELQVAKDWLEKNDIMTWIYYQLILYCYIRPNELRFAKVETINKAMVTITPGASEAKNSDEEAVYIPNFLLSQLKNYLTPFGPEVPGHFYLFSAIDSPGLIPVGDNFFRHRFQRMRKATGLPEDLKLYGLKGTGGKMAAKSGVNLLFLKDQFRHKSLDMTYRYLGRYQRDEQEGEKIDKLNSWEKQA